MDFYGKMPWILIQRITLPLCVFFRFHSTVVLSELWKNSYRWQNEINNDYDTRTLPFQKNIMNSQEK